MKAINIPEWCIEGAKYILTTINNEKQRRNYKALFGEELPEVTTEVVTAKYFHIYPFENIVRCTINGDGWGCTDIPISRLSPIKKVY